MNNINFDYRYNEQWDSDHNQKQLHGWVGARFTCPAESSDIQYPYVSYLMLRRRDETGSIVDIGDLPSDAVLLVESVGSHVRYGEPEDLELEELLREDKPFGAGKLHSRHNGIVRGLRVDGKLVDIDTGLSNEALRSLLVGREGTKVAK